MTRELEAAIRIRDAEFIANPALRLGVLCREFNRAYYEGAYQNPRVIMPTLARAFTRLAMQSAQYPVLQAAALQIAANVRNTLH